MSQELPQAPPSCPRCGVSTPGNYKFCPECAFRLRQVVRPPPEMIRPGRLPGLMFLAAVIGFTVTFAVAGLLVFSPEAPGETRYERPRSRFMVDEILEEMVYLESAAAYYKHADLDPALEDSGAPFSPGSPPLETVYVDQIGMMRYEVTCGQYAEFLNDMARDPKQVVGLHVPISAAINPQSQTRRLWCDRYAGYWWSEVARHVSEERVDRPLDLRVPLIEKYHVLLLVPPQWVRLDKTGLSWELPVGSANLPVTGVSLYEADAFAKWLSQKLGRSFRLPLHAEWRRAYHGGEPPTFNEETNELEGNRFPWGAEAHTGICNTLSLYKGLPEEPRLFPVNATFHWYYKPWTKDRIYNMAGNAREWVYAEVIEPQTFEDLEQTFYYAALNKDANGHIRIESSLPTVGGSYRNAISECSEDWQIREDVRSRAPDLGFRLVVIPE